MEAEAQALVAALQVLATIVGVLESMGCHQLDPPTIFQDNKSLILAVESELSYTGAHYPHGGEIPFYSATAQG